MFPQLAAILVLACCGAAQGQATRPVAAPIDDATTLPAPAPGGGATTLPAPTPGGGATTLPAPTPGGGATTLPAPTPGGGAVVLPAPVPPNALLVDIDSLTLQSSTIYTWNVTKTATPATVSIAAGVPTSVTYVATYERSRPSGATEYRMVLSVFVTNPGASAVRLDKVQATIARAGQPNEYLPLECDTIDKAGFVSVPPGGRVVCNASRLIGDEGPTTVIVQVFALGRVFSDSDTLDFAAASSVELGFCARISDTFFQTSGGDYATPEFVTGVKAPAQGSEIEVCRTTSYRYSATFEFTKEQCGSWLAVNSAVATPFDSEQPAQIVPAQVVFTVKGCEEPPATTPVITLYPPSTAVVGYKYDWTVQRTLLPAAKAVSLQAGEEGAMALSTVVKRGAQRPYQGYLVYGRVQLVNPNTKAMGIAGVVMQISRGADDVPISVNATCPGVYYVDPKFYIQPKTSINCSYSIPYPDSQPSILTALVYMFDGSIAVSNLQPFNFLGSPYVEDGRCANLFDTQQWYNVAKDGPAPPPLTTSGVGIPAPPKKIQVCEDTTWSQTITFGPFTSKGCGEYRFSSIVTFEPMFGATSRPGVGLNMYVTGCPSTAVPIVVPAAAVPLRR